MNRFIAFSVIFFALIPLGLHAQKGGPVVFTVDEDTVWGAEFERVFNKNNKNPEVRPSQTEIEEYENLYIRFKLKVKEAYRMGMDTNADYNRELAGYRKQLAQPYLTDKSVTEKLIKEAYDRMKFEVNGSNLMIPMSAAASPEDTLAAWTRINMWRDLIVSGKYSFDQLSRDSSLDEHGRTQGGKLGYYSAFNMIYPFENMSYNTPVGQVSPVFRTQFGYHVVMVNDKRPARSDIKVSHILIRINTEADYETNKPRIDAIYDRLKASQKKKGADQWNQLVLDFSEDFNTRERGGELNWIKSIGGNVPEEFREAAYALKDGQFSAPVKSELGWHIIRRMEQKPFPTYEEAKESIKLKISRDMRSELNREAVLERVKGENNFKIYEKNWTLYLAKIDSNFVNGVQWNSPPDMSSDEVLFSIQNKKYTFADFTEFVKINAAMGTDVSPEMHAMALFDQFGDDKNLEFEEMILEEKYPDFHYLMQEYRDGILLFELTNKEVWSKATSDTLGLKNYFEVNRTKYQWKERAVIRQYVCSNSKTAKKVGKALQTGMSDSLLLSAMNKKNALALKITEKVVERGQDSTLDRLQWQGIQVSKDAGRNTTYVRFDEIIPPGLKLMKEAMGPVTSDYQNFLEDRWIDELKQRFSVKRNPESLTQLFNGKP